MSWVSLSKLNYFAQELAAKIKTKFVAKETGKGLSTNDYTTAEKQKLSGIAANAEVNVQSDWSETNSASDAYIKNKPTSLPADGGDADTVAGHTVESDVPENAKFTDTVYTHPNSGVTSGTYRSVTVDEKGHVTAGSNPATLEEYGINQVDVSLLQGIINIENLPAGALERCIVVEDDTARFALTTDNVQKGDTVKVTSTGLMYFVKDDTKLSSEDGYEVYTAGGASQVPWAGITGKPETFPPTGHTHTVSQITDLQEATETEIDDIIAGLFTD